jgi:hypothetical protein
MPKRTFAQRFSTAELVMARSASRGRGESIHFELNQVDKIQTDPVFRGDDGATGRIANRPRPTNFRLRKR